MIRLQDRSVRVLAFSVSRAILPGSFPSWPGTGMVKEEDQCPPGSLRQQSGRRTDHFHAAIRLPGRQGRCRDKPLAPLFQPPLPLAGRPANVFTESGPGAQEIGVLQLARRVPPYADARELGDTDQEQDERR